MTLGSVLWLETAAVSDGGLRGTQSGMLSPEAGTTDQFEICGYFGATRSCNGVYLP